MISETLTARGCAALFSVLFLVDVGMLPWGGGCGGVATGRDRSQWSATRPDMFPEALCEELARLHKDAPRHGWAHTRREVDRALVGQSPQMMKRLRGHGRDRGSGAAEGGDEPAASIESFFDTFSRAPIASGSIAQVHYATRGGAQLAVKVRHPRVEEQITNDFRLMNSLMEALDRFVPALAWLNLRSSA